MAVLAAFAADIRHVLAILAHCFTAFLADRGHVFAILAHGLPALAPGFTRFFRTEFVGVTALVCCTSTLAGDFTLPRFIHTGEPAAATITVFICHFFTPDQNARHAYVPHAAIIPKLICSGGLCAVKSACTKRNGTDACVPGKKVQ
jgi:hypothetical protein